MVVPLRDDLDLMLVDVTYTDGSAERYQVIVRWDSRRPTSTAPSPRSAAPTITPATTRCTTRDARAVPAVADRLVGRVVRRHVHQGTRRAILPLDAAPRVSDAEQSNTSVVFEQEAIFKVFRRVAPGINPDIELNRVLGRAGNPHVARLLGSIEMTVGRRVLAAGHGDRVRGELRRRLGHGHREHPRPVRRGRPVRLRGRRRLRRRVVPARRGGRFGARHAGREAGHDGGRLSRSRRCWRGCRPPRRRCRSCSRTCRRSRSGSPSSPTSRSPCSACTATCTWARCCAPRKAGC